MPRAPNPEPSQPSKKPKPLLAYSVTEPDEGTGGIVFATSAIAARRIGADLYCDGEFSYARCRRAPYADRYAATAQVPASALVGAGWHFECSGCSVRIDTDLPDRWRDEAGPTDTFREILAAARRYRHWHSDAVIGDQNGAVFCDAACQAKHLAHEAERKRRQARAIEAFKRRVLKRFPDATFPENNPDNQAPTWLQHHHAYAKMRNGRWRLRQIRVAFAFPGMVHGHAELSYNPQSYHTRNERKPAFTCCAGDKEAFEAWAAQRAKEETDNV